MGGFYDHLTTEKGYIPLQTFQVDHRNHSSEIRNLSFNEMAIVRFKIWHIFGTVNPF